MSSSVKMLYDTSQGSVSRRSFAGKMYKKAWHTCRVVVLVIKSIAFTTSLLPLPSWLLKTPYSMPRRTSSWLYFLATQALFKRIQHVVTISSNFVRCLIGMVLARIHPTMSDPLHHLVAWYWMLLDNGWNVQHHPTLIFCGYSCFTLS